VVVAAVETNDHAFVHLGAWADEQTSTLLQGKEGIAQHLAVHHGHHNAVDAPGIQALLEGAEMVEDVRQDTATRGKGHELRTEANQTAGRHDEVQAHPALAIRHHVLQFGAAVTHFFHDRALVRLFDVDHYLLVRLLDLAIDFLGHYFRPRDTKLETFAAHGFDQHRQVQFTTTGDDELVR